MKCKSCGAELEEGAIFCKECGTDNSSGEKTDALNDTKEASNDTEEASSEDEIVAQEGADEAEEKAEVITEDAAEVLSADEEQKKPKRKIHINAEAYLFFGIGIVVLAIFLYAAYRLGAIGTDTYNMVVEQYGGESGLEDSMKEIIELQTSIYGVGAVALRALGVFCAAVLAWLGFRSNKQ